MCFTFVADFNLVEFLLEIFVTDIQNRRFLRYDKTIFGRINLQHTHFDALSGKFFRFIDKFWGELNLRDNTANTHKLDEDAAFPVFSTDDFDLFFFLFFLFENIPLAIIKEGSHRYYRISIFGFFRDDADFYAASYFEVFEVSGSVF